MIKDIFRVFFTNLIKFFVTIIASFIIPAILSVEQYGYYKLFGLYTAYLGLFHLGFCDGIFLNYGGKSLDKINKKQISDERKTLFILECILSILVISYGVFKNNSIIIVSGLSIIPCIFITFYTYIYQATGDFEYYSQVYNFNSIITLFLNVILVIAIKPSYGMTFIVVSVLINYLTFFYATWSFNRKCKLPRGTASINILFNNIKTGILLLFGNLGYLLFESIDRLFIQGVLGLTFFAYYSFASQLLSALNMFANPIGLTLYSHLARKKSQKFEYQIKISVISLLLFLLNGVYVLRWIVGVFFKKYMQAEPIIILLFVAQVFVLINTIIYINLFKMYKMQNKYFQKLLIAIVMSIVLNFSFYFGVNKSIVSVAFATFCSMIIWTIINAISFKKLYLNVRNLSFLIVMVCVYLLTSYLCNAFIGMIIYLLIWIVSFRILVPEVYNLVLNQIKDKITRI